ncbi:MAG: hypothetical protein GOV01_01715 [Candidatus Altiarchaeota archaeon]|nr:hypothetical protein [Candidatus Altiarchaeota archaeon]
MPVWRVTINDVKAERKDKVPKGMTVEVKPSLLKAEKEKAGEVNLVKAEYKLSCLYQPDFGAIEVAGHIYFIDVDADKVLENGRIIDPEVVRQAYQRIFVEPMVTAIGLAKELLLPLPVRMPEIKIEAVGKKSKK